MRIQIVARRFSQTSTLREMVELRLNQALGRVARRIAEATVSFEDLNGPRGGLDVQCRIKLRLDPRGEINVSAVAAEPSVALADAANRAERCLRTRTQRRRMQHRRSRFSMEPNISPTGAQI